ncbi:AAA family ATPase [Nonomuraea sp. NPDC050536]|uniref:AAA family ATPase n=1 Tax=Nonomuraea sp. NPDC050536 TaxID=3364366 RepID=UPI0037C6ACD6
MAFEGEIRNGAGDGRQPEQVWIPVGLVLLVGPPASGKSSFIQALIDQDKIDPEAVVSSDAIAEHYLNTSVDRESADPQIFQERDRRVAARLAAGCTAIAESTNVLPHARARLLAIASRLQMPVTALRFTQPEKVLLEQNQERRKALPATEVSRYAALMAEYASTGQLYAEGVSLVQDVPGRAQHRTASQAARLFEFRTAS